MNARVAVRITGNFERKLDEIEAFLTQAEVPDELEQLLEELSEQVIPTLERHPNVGQDYLSRSADSIEAQVKRRVVIDLLNALGDSGSIREYVLTHYLILYARLPETIHLLAIRHQRQLAFDLGRADPAF